MPAPFAALAGLEFFGSYQLGGGSFAAATGSSNPGSGRAFGPVSVSGLVAAPAWSADPHVIAFCQSAAAVLGLSWAVVLLRRQLARSWQAWLGASALARSLAAAGRWLVAIPLA